MAPPLGRPLRDNLFLVGALALPLVVVGFFLLSTAIPRWTVPPPGHDLVLRTTSWRQGGPLTSVEFSVKDGRLMATVRPLPAQSGAQRVRLWRFDHAAMTVREIPVALPEQLDDGEAVRTIEVEAFPGLRVLDQTTAPDGYEVQTGSRNSPGVIGEVFGMRRYGRTVSIARRGRVIPIQIPTEETYQSPVFIGWLIDE
jgi:hypothetical protein